jgi:hypothetical protein
MSTTKLPNELECLAARLASGVSELVYDTRALPADFASANGWAPTLQVPDSVADLLLGACALQFDAVRLAALVQAQDAALRRIYTQSLYLVDNLRMGAGVAKSEAAEPFLQAGLETVADMQELIQTLFPGDICISA